jgi:hypothetical protein
MLTKRGLIAMASSLLAMFAPSVSAQDPNLPAAPVVFLEKANFSIASPTGKNLYFEGLPAVHYFLHNGLGDPVWQKNGGWTWAMPVSGLFMVRMTATTSEPVRTPSYRIRPLAVQMVHLTRPANDKLAFGLFGGMLAAAHYSNGQAGCTYQGFLRDSVSGQCKVTNFTLASERVANTIDGDFSTSYFSAGVNYRRGRLVASDDPVKWQWTVGGELQIHPYDMQPGGINRSLARTFGHHEWTVNAEVERRPDFDKLPGIFRPLLLFQPGSLRLAGSFTQRFGGGVDSPLNAGQLELSYVIDSASHVGWFVRRHQGFDYYNIRFQDARGFWAFGLIWDVARMDKLNTDTR